MDKTEVYKEKNIKNSMATHDANDLFEDGILLI